MVTGNPLVTETDMILDPTVGAAGQVVGGISAARARFTESVQFNNVLNQEPSPNMRGMITFVEPTAVMVEGGAAPSPVSVCFFSRGKEITSSDGNKGSQCDKLEVKNSDNTRVQVLGADKELPSWFTLSTSETSYENYPAFGPTSEIAGEGGTTTAGMIDGIPEGDLRYGYNWYDKKLCLGNFVKTVVATENDDPPEGTSAVQYTVFHKSTRNVTAEVLDTIDVDYNNERRRHLLATFCPDGFESRLIPVGLPTKEACKCESNACGRVEAECTTTRGGTSDWNQVLLLERNCRDEEESSGDNVGAIVGGVLGGFFGALLLALLAWFLCCRNKKPAQNYDGRAPAPVDPMPAVPASKPLAPVYLPQPYPALPEQFGAAPMPPAFPEMGVVQPTGQPTLYSSMQGMPYPPMSGSFPAAPPPMSGSYPAPYGVVQQPMY